MKKLLFLPLLVLMTSCVTYYYPETAVEDGVYYAEDDPSYVVYSEPYVGASYYPWSSLDYFYMGYSPYRRADYGYSRYGSGFSFGVSYSYSPWYYPSSYYGYYSPWYDLGPYYSYYPSQWGYYGHCGRYRDCRRGYKNNHHRSGHDRYTRRDRNHDRRQRRGEHSDRNTRSQKRYRDNNENRGASRSTRYVSTTPPGHGGNQGMVIRSNEMRKPGKSRVQPDRPVQRKSASASPTESPAVQREHRTRLRGSEIHYRSGAKQTRARTGPVGTTGKSGYSVNRNVAASRPEPAQSRSTQSQYRTKSDANEVRYRSGSKKSRARTGPARSAVPSKNTTVNAPAAPSAKASSDARGRPQRAPGRQHSSRGPSSGSAAPRPAAAKPQATSASKSSPRPRAKSRKERRAKNRDSSHRDDRR